MFSNNRVDSVIKRIHDQLIEDYKKVNRFYRREKIKEEVSFSFSLTRLLYDEPAPLKGIIITLLSNLNEYYSTLHKEITLSSNYFLVHCIFHKAGCLLQANFKEEQKPFRPPSRYLSWEQDEEDLVISAHNQFLSHANNDKEFLLSLWAALSQQKNINISSLTKQSEYSQQDLSSFVLRMDLIEAMKIFITNPFFTAGYVIEHHETISDITLLDDICFYLTKEMELFMGLAFGLPDEMIRDKISQLEKIMELRKKLLVIESVKSIEILNILVKDFIQFLKQKPSLPKRVLDQFKKSMFNKAFAMAKSFIQSTESLEECQKCIVYAYQFATK